ncbi:MAG: hypothetical protein ACP5IC_02390, partial [Minisyncoccia bacterium]
MNQSNKKVVFIFVLIIIAIVIGGLTGFVVRKYFVYNTNVFRVLKQTNNIEVTDKLEQQNITTSNILMQNQPKLTVENNLIDGVIKKVYNENGNLICEVNVN